MKKFGKESGLVIATGGGCVTREENYRHLRQNGNIVFIERSLTSLARKDRPLSQGNLEDMYDKRLPLYRRFAGCVVQNEGNVSGVVKSITELIQGLPG
jgi:shikimate dehydrogenase